MELRSTTFEDGGTIPRQHGRDAGNQPPALRWSDVPGQAQELALIVEDPDAPHPDFAHWVAWGIDPHAGGVDGGLPGDVTEGMNDFGGRGYGGPAPPKGEEHRYVFRLLALDEHLPLDERASRDDVLSAAEGHVIDEARLTAIYPG